MPVEVVRHVVVAGGRQPRAGGSGDRRGPQRRRVRLEPRRDGRGGAGDVRLLEGRGGAVAGGRLRAHGERRVAHGRAGAVAGGRGLAVGEGGRERRLAVHGVEVEVRVGGEVVLLAGQRHARRQARRRLRHRQPPRRRRLGRRVADRAVQIGRRLVGRQSAAVHRRPLDRDRRRRRRHRRRERRRRHTLRPRHRRRALAAHGHPRRFGHPAPPRGRWALGDSLTRRQKWAAARDWQVNLGIPRGQAGDGVRPLRQHRPHGLASVPRDDVLRRPAVGRVGAPRGAEPGDDRARVVQGDQLLGHGQRLLEWRKRARHRPCPAEAQHPPGARRDRDQGVLRHLCRDHLAPRNGREAHGAGRPVPPRAEPQVHHVRGRPIPQEAGDGLHRPLPNPPVRSQHPRRGNHACAARPRAVGQGALHRGEQHVGVAAEQDELHRQDERLDALCFHAGFLQSPLQGRGTRDDSPPAGPRHGLHPLVPPRARRAHGQGQPRDRAHAERPVLQDPRQGRRRRGRDRREGVRGGGEEGGDGGAGCPGVAVHQAVHHEPDRGSVQEAPSGRPRRRGEAQADARGGGVPGGALPAQARAGAPVGWMWRWEAEPVGIAEVRERRRGPTPKDELPPSHAKRLRSARPRMESSVACEQPATPSLFSAAEWAALFPAPLPEPADAADVASELREIAANAAADGTGAPPLGPEELLAGLAGAPAVRLLVRLGAFLGRVVLPRYGILRIAQQAFTLFFVALIWIENDGRFGTRQLVVATVAHVRLAIWDFRVLGGHFAPSDKHVWLREEAAAVSGPSAGRHALASIVRYRELVQNGGSKLTEHVLGDSLCTCPRATCCGDIIRSALALYVAAPIVNTLLYWAAFVVLYVWTPAVTFGSATWSTAWAATLSAVGIAVIAFFLIVVVVGTLANARNVPLFALDTRMRRRAASRCLEALLVELRETSTRLEGAWRPRKAECEPYFALHAALVATWQATKAVAEVTRAVAVTGMLAEAVGLLIVLIGSSCIPAYNLGGLLLTITVVFVNDLVILAAANTSPDRIAALYCTAAQSLRTIGMSAVADGRPEVAAAAQWHDRILTGFADVDPYRARAFGIPVTFDLIRTMVATLFTLGVGLWSVLRGAGVGVTIDLVCPSPSSVG